MRHLAAFCVLMMTLVGSVQAQTPTTDVLGIHDMGAFSQGPLSGGLPPCQYCHAPHSGLSNIRPLWAQKLSTQTNYSLYSSTTMVNTVLEPTLGSASNLCLSCHDGTVAPGTTVPYGAVKMQGSMSAQDVFGTNLSTTHPFNFKLPLSSTTPNVYPSVLSGKTTNPAVKMPNGNIQCTTCHDPHVEAKDPVAQNFLVVNNSGSALCLACHQALPTQTDPHSMAVLRSQIEARAGTTATTTASVESSGIFGRWSLSGHAVASHRVSKTVQLGPYGNTRQNACLSCHTPHKASGASALLTGPVQPVLGMDAVTQNCISCHNGGTTLTPAIPNVFAEFSKAGHPFQTGSSKHNNRESLILNNDRHATCVDCHEPHSSAPTASFLATNIRPSQHGVVGVSAVDGTTIVSPAANQYEICLRCHGTSTGKQSPAVLGYLPARATNTGDPLNIIPQFNAAATSSHPVMHDSNSPLPQPSLLKVMLNLDGHTQGRPMGTRLLCTDCHNSDDNREFGGTGPNGPHGSKFSHVLERRYEFSQVAMGLPPLAGPGTTIQNLLPPIVDPVAGPYAMCAKCHDLGNVMSNVSFSKHSVHINAGFSCSVCHTAHGMSASSDNVSGVRMVNFDLRVVAANDTTNAPIAYNRSKNTCTLKCHTYNHNADGTVQASSLSRTPPKH